MYKVFVLGSGFSIKAGAPLSRTLLSRIFCPERSNSKLIQLKAYLENFLYPEQPDWINCTDLEEVLSRLDLIKNYKPYPSVNYNDVIYYEELLLAEFTNLISPCDLNPSADEYLLFRDMVSDYDSIISFNYDLVVEFLWSASGRNYNYNLNQSDSTTILSNSVNLIKLHGSINLYYCPACGNVFHFSAFITDHPVPGEKHSEAEKRVRALTCNTCKDHGEPVSLRHFIIAPTLFKSYTLPALRRLWFKALELLVNADDIIIIGYSLPKADILSYQLFDFSSRMAAKNQRIFLVKGPRPVPDQLSQIYGSSLINTGEYFEEWVKRDSIYFSQG